MLRLITLKACQETISVLVWLLDQARRGQLRGLAICFWTASGTREVLLTGIYRAQPELALGAADLIKVTACHQLDLFA
jgi:hypothetical protein